MKIDTSRKDRILITTHAGEIEIVEGVNQLKQKSATVYVTRHSDARYVRGQRFTLICKGKAIPKIQR